MDGKKFDKNTLKTLIIAASLLLNCILGGASYTYYHHLAEQMNETASLQSQVSHLEGSVSDLQAQADESQPAIDDLKAQVASLTEEKNGLQTQVDTLTSQKADLQKQVDTLKAGASSGSSSGGSSSDSSGSLQQLGRPERDRLRHGHRLQISPRRLPVFEEKPDSNVAFRSQAAGLHRLLGLRRIT